MPLRRLNMECPVAMQPGKVFVISVVGWHDSKHQREYYFIEKHRCFLLFLITDILGQGIVVLHKKSGVSRCIFLEKNQSTLY